MSLKSMKGLAVEPEREERILEGCRKGEVWARKALFEEYRDSVYSAALNFFNCPATAMDVTQEVFLKVFQKIPDFRGEARFRSWLYRITVNHCLNLARSRRRWFPLGPLQHLPWSARRDRPDSLAESAEKSEQVRVAIQALAPELRVVVVLRYVEGLSYRDISDVLECAMGTVASRLNRAHAELGKRLGQLRSSQ